MDSPPGNPTSILTRTRARTALAVLALFACCGLSILARGARREDPATSSTGPATIATAPRFDTQPLAVETPVPATEPVPAVPVEAAAAPVAVDGESEGGGAGIDGEEVGAPTTAEVGGSVGDTPSLAPAGSFAAYAEAILPLVQEALRAAERDGAVLEAAENNPEALCGGVGRPHPQLTADAALMADIRSRLDAISAPASAVEVVHEPLLKSVRLWNEALDDLNRACGTDEPLRQGLERIGAVAKMGGAILSFQRARDGFSRLLLAEGLEELAAALRGG
jgi:hypothetical protein